MIADAINVVTDQELREYQSTGRKMDAPKMSSKVKAERRASFSAKKNGTEQVVSAPVSTMPEEKPKPAPRQVADIPPVKKLYVHVKDPDDHSSLLALKQACGNFPGGLDIVLVLGESKKSAIKLPFQVDGTDLLVGELVKLLGEDCVVVK